VLCGRHHCGMPSGATAAGRSVGGFTRVPACRLTSDLTDMLLTSRGASDFAIEPPDWADPMKQVLSAQVSGPSRIPGWFAEVVSAASKLSSMPTPAGSLASSWVWFRTGTLLTV